MFSAAYGVMVPSLHSHWAVLAEDIKVMES